MRKIVYKCDLCGGDLYTNFSDEMPIRIKVKADQKTIFGCWDRMDICVYCQRAIAAYSRALRGEENNDE